MRGCEGVTQSPSTCIKTFSFTLGNHQQLSEQTHNQNNSVRQRLKYYGRKGNNCLTCEKQATCYFINHAIKYSNIYSTTVLVTCHIRRNYKLFL